MSESWDKVRWLQYLSLFTSDSKVKGKATGATLGKLDGQISILNKKFSS